ncbi:hypothetical protein CLM62_08445 [Streptomyces sp. SA15]|uniref:Lrp/AsnC family transcriptional regulator n=1 Tax=Streptomyces sp. SA15 TaxID=934019 RepID=UPI000BB0C29A|nr:Lrp/AsnC family transcriptional regulator [Streptomyces sp. SA15]PAZ16343.1 hypothetical protein CLM62_08445 [Streptomyces sp. SA15]
MAGRRRSWAPAAALESDGRAPYTELARQVDSTALTIRRRTERLAGRAVRLAAEVDLALLGVHAEAQLWITLALHALDRTAQALSHNTQIRFTAATTGPANLPATVAAIDLHALQDLLTDSLGALQDIVAVETTPILNTAKRAGLLRARPPHVPPRGR